MFKLSPSLGIKEVVKTMILNLKQKFAPEKPPVNTRQSDTA